MFFFVFRDHGPVLLRAAVRLPLRFLDGGSPLTFAAVRRATSHDLPAERPQEPHARSSHRGR